MTAEDAIKVLSVMKAAYPRFYADMTKSEAQSVIALWADMFSEDSVEIVAAAVKSFIASDAKGFPPHIGAIKDEIYKLKHKDEMTESEAWALVAKAIRRSAYFAKEEFDKLPEICQRLVGSPEQLKEWALCESIDTMTVAQSNFMRSYKARAKTEREFAALPSSVKSFMIGCGNMMRLEDGEKC